MKRYVKKVGFKKVSSWFGDIAKRWDWFGMGNENAGSILGWLYRKGTDILIEEELEKLLERVLKDMKTASFDLEMDSFVKDHQLRKLARALIASTILDDIE